MYCRFCGKQINDDSKFCSYCGKELSDSIKSSAEGTMERTEASASEVKVELVEKTEKKSLLPFFVFIVFFVAFFVILMVVMTETPINSNDYSYTTSQDLTSYSVTVTPNKNIDICEIECILYDINGKVLFSDTITKENLKKCSSYTYTFDFGFVNSLTGNNVKIYITGKR